MFGQEQQLIISLQDENEAEGLRLELMDCAFPCLQDVEVSRHLDVCLRNANFNFLLSEQPKTPTLTNVDYLKVNA